MANTEKAIRPRQAASIDRSLSNRRGDTYRCRLLNLGVLRNAAVAELGSRFNRPELSPGSTFNITDRFRAVVQTLARQMFPSLSENWMGK